MKRGYLSEYFEGVALKRLSAVEADKARSNQHEYNATRELRAFLGTPDEAVRFATRYIFLNDEVDPIVIDAFSTLYDARKKHETRSEYRLYFPETQVSEKASAGDLLVIAKRQNGDLLLIIAESGSSSASQIEWLFGDDASNRGDFATRLEPEEERDKIGFTAAFVLETIGIELEPDDDNYLDEMLSKFDGAFPKTKIFSEFARSTLQGVDCRDDPDNALMAWMEREEALFRTLERHLVKGRLQQGFSAEHIDEFIDFSLSVQNRRKSRVGYSLENHIEVVFQEHGIRYKRTAITENKSKPDFLFPGQNEYHDPAFNPLLLTMLAVKSTCKDRWRQALAEADRIEDKHLLTLEPRISANQTNEMQAKRLQLVVPRPLHPTYNADQQAWLFDVRSFTDLALSRQP